ncbi:hypothetical protein HOG48_04220 [Candidatus Peregrinibacteria bacterium]|jgi:hypothetical protein|nr:hypothetical protein [Candidatus Peregrinibacteria bacterium]
MTQEYPFPSGFTPEVLPTDAEILHLLFMLWSKLPEDTEEATREYCFLRNRIDGPRALLQRHLTPPIFRMVVERRRALREKLRELINPLRFKVMIDGRLHLA